MPTIRRRSRKSGTGITNKANMLSSHVKTVFSDHTTTKKKKKAVWRRRRRQLTKTLYDAAMKRCDGQFRKLFRLFDEDGDGKISREDFKRSLKYHNCGFTGDPDEAFRSIDVNEDGAVSYSEFCNIFFNNPTLCLKGTTIQTEQFNDSKAYRKIPQEALDREGSRVIEKLSEKLRSIAVTDKLLHRPVNTTLREAFKKMDLNGDGWLSYDEVCSAVCCLFSLNLLFFFLHTVHSLLLLLLYTGT